MYIVAIDAVIELINNGHAYPLRVLRPAVQTLHRSGTLEISVGGDGDENSLNRFFLFAGVIIVKVRDLRPAANPIAFSGVMSPSLNKNSKV